MSNELQTLVDNFLHFYTANKHKSELNQITNFILTHALSARGYNNYQNQIESGELFFINEVLAKTQPKLCIDVGANKGEYSLTLLNSTEAHVIAFEPLSDTFEILKNNLREFSNRIKLENFGVGAKEEELMINYNPNAASHASFSKDVEEIDYLNNHIQKAVPLVTLDSYFKKNGIKEVDLIKIDVEGFESEVFAGAKDIFAKIRPKFIQIEFNWHQLFRNTSLHFFSTQLPGYKIYQLIPQGWIQRESKDPLSNIFMFSNFIFVRSDQV
jgi:FkbM family methyltransferase